MKHIFEGNWVYLAHESQVPNVGDYFTTYIGRQPVVITRDKDGNLQLPHQRLRTPRRHAVPPQDRQPHDAHLPVPRLDVPQRRRAAEGQGPRGRRLPGDVQQRAARHDLTKVARFDSYRGFLFGTLNPDVLPLEEHLGDATKVIDCSSTSPPRASRCCAARRPTPTTATGRCRPRTAPTATTSPPTHWNYAATTARRTAGDSANSTKAMDAGKWGKSGGGYYSYDHGHLLLWTGMGQPARTVRCGTAARSSVQVRRGEGELHGQGLAQPLPVPERLHHGPVLHRRSATSARSPRTRPR